MLEVYCLDRSGRYQLQAVDANGRYWIAEMDLVLAVWQGSRENHTGAWLRWWDAKGNLLLWGTESVERERQRAERLAEQLRLAGIEPDM